MFERNIGWLKIDSKEGVQENSKEHYFHPQEPCFHPKEPCIRSTEGDLWIHTTVQEKLTGEIVFAKKVGFSASKNSPATGVSDYRYSSSRCMARFKGCRALFVDIGLFWVDIGLFWVDARARSTFDSKEGVQENSKEHYFHPKEPCFHPKEPCIRSTEPYNSWVITSFPAVIWFGGVDAGLVWVDVGLFWVDIGLIWVDAELFWDAGFLWVHIGGLTSWVMEISCARKCTKTHTHTHTNIHTHTHARISAHTHIHIHTYTHTHTYASTHTHTYIPTASKLP